MSDHPLALAAADALAAWVLDGKTDKQGHPLIEHCRRVAERCAHLSTEQQVAALLHDCIEDAPERLTLRAVGDIFGPEVAAMVDDLTRRPGEPYEQYIRGIASSGRGSIAVKLADLDDNLDEERRGALPEPERSRLRGRYLVARGRLLLALERNAAAGPRPAEMERSE